MPMRWEYPISNYVAPLMKGEKGMEFFTNLANLLNQFRQAMGTIVGPIAILCVAFCAIKIIMADNPREVQTAKSWLIGIIIGVILFYFAPSLINSISALAPQ